MNHDRFRALTSAFSGLTIGVLGDFCLDRYLEIDPARQETSIETGLPVHQVVSVRAQPGGAGTILNNLVALGVGRILAMSFCGDDGEGYELRRALGSKPGVVLDHFLTTPERRTFTYCKPLLIEPGRPPVELNRLDSRNWTPTPDSLTNRFREDLRALGPTLDALIVLEQVDRAETGVVTRGLLDEIAALAAAHPDLPILADSRRGLADWPGLSFKMNAVELAALLGERADADRDLASVRAIAATLAGRNRRPVFVTLAERGIVAAGTDGETQHVPALPVRGPIDIVGAGDSVTANLAAALAAGATLREAIALAAVASSVVIHQLGTTGAATVADLESFLGQIPAA
ncbi:bifunctional heptose 7-phosphate kinase/heptose 1-phosphate adenyltransferase [Aquisphaera insulae]|uniref:bifunctional heptose 7-phosphate kinase/heptose 1-phosphate adenyltransferase n=1 Tax=Aquisphaera insulae TaxID=2712864 RepID=UPI0013EAD062|nr:PfkB family carbohydrate kinase [Aquisphaera insulae]